MKIRFPAHKELTQYRRQPSLTNKKRKKPNTFVIVNLLVIAFSTAMLIFQMLQANFLMDYTDQPNKMNDPFRTGTGMYRESADNNRRNSEKYLHSVRVVGARTQSVGSKHLPRPRLSFEKDNKDTILDDKPIPPPPPTLKLPKNINKLQPSGMSKIVWIWEEGAEQLYTTNSRCVNAMKKLNPTWEIMVIGKVSVGANLAPIFSSIVNNGVISRRMGKAMQANLLQLELLSRHGGVWAESSVCPFIDLDSHIPKWIGAEAGFYAPPLELSHVSRKDIPKNASSCHDWNVVGNTPAGFRTSDNWFMASVSNNPLIAEWLKVFLEHLTDLDRAHLPFYLAHCSLTQARMKNSTVNDIWAQFVSHWDNLKSGKSHIRRPCYDDGSNTDKGIEWYLKNCAFVQKQKSKNVKDYVLSSEYVNYTDNFDPSKLAEVVKPFNGAKGKAKVAQKGKNSTTRKKEGELLSYHEKFGNLHILLNQ